MLARLYLCCSLCTFSLQHYVLLVCHKHVEPTLGILREAIVKLGDPNTYVMEHPLRLIECNDSEGNVIRILTSDFSLETVEISDLYRNWWQIELFFKWIKQHLLVKKCYGTSKNAVYNQIRLALITYCLTLLMQKNITYQGRLLNVFKHLQLCWAEPFETFIKALFRPPSRHSKGRR